MKRYSKLICMSLILLMSANIQAKNKNKDGSDEFECEKVITDLSVIYDGDEAVDVVVYDKEKKGSVLHNFSTVEKGDILDVSDLAEAKKEILWELFEVGTDNKIGESLFYLKCKDDNMDGPEDCGNVLGDGKKEDKDDSYLNSWLFNGLTDEEGNSFRCDLPQTHLVPPTLTLLGNEQILLEIGDDFIDPGAEAIDDLDGDLTSLITIETDLDILTVGAYTVTYSVTDFDGNTATATRNVTVSDENVKVRTLMKRVSVSSDDAEEDTIGKMYLSSSDLELAYDDTDLYTKTVGIRFSNLNIPQDSIIQNAYIQFKVDEVSEEDTTLAVYAEKNGDSPTFYTSAYNITNRTRTNAVVAWEPVPWTEVGAAGVDQRTPDLSEIVQEVVSTSGYVNSLTFIMDGRVKRIAEAYDGDPDGAPMLYVEYLGGTVIQPIKVAPKIKHILALNSEDYELINEPDQGSIEINTETKDFAYLADPDATGRDVLKFKTTGSLSDVESHIIEINLTPAPVLLNGVELPEFSSNIPLLILDTNSLAIPDDPKIKGVLTIIPPGTSGRSSLTETPEYSDFMEIELRGSSSLQFPKNGYGLDTEDFEGEDIDPELLGMPEEHKWVMHGPYSDKSLMRNYIAYNKTREMGGYSAVRTKYVEVLVREGNGYRYDGIYVFMEKIKRDSNRVDIKKLDPEDSTYPDITGGYIMADDRAKEDWNFETSLKGSTVVMEYPDTEDITDEQKVYIENYMNSFENALFADDFNDPDSENYYGNYVEADTFVKHLLSRELFRDVDTWDLSEFFSKERSGKLSMLPVWDFNLSMGNANYGYGGSVSGWEYEGHNSSTGGWMNRLMEDAEFRADVREKWTELRAGSWSDENLNQFIDETKELLQESQSRNFQRWPVLGTYVWPNRTACDGGTAYCDTWDKAVDDHLRVWLLARAAWMDANIP